MNPTHFVIALTLLLATAASSAAGQQPARDATSLARLERSLDAETYRAVVRVIEQARARALPTDPLVDRALEGAMKRAPGPRISAAVSTLAQRLDVARAMLAPAPTEADIAAGAGALAVGVPRDVLRTTLSYARPNGFYLAPTLDWVPQGAFADHANTLRAPGYALIGVQTGVNFPNGVSVFLDARNLADKRFVSDISVIADARRAPTTIFYPGDGRSVYAGLRYSF